MDFTEQAIQLVWSKAHFVSEENERRGFRKDECGAWVKRTEYGNRDSQYGWEIDHIVPVSWGGSSSLSNLRPLQWQNNVATSNNHLTCAVAAVT